MGNTAKQWRLGLFQDSDFAGNLEDSKSTFGETLCVSGSHTFVPVSWMCKKQTVVSHSSTKSENISVEIGLRLNGLLGLELWDLIVSVFRKRDSDRMGRLVDTERSHKSQGKINALKNIDCVPSNVQFSCQEGLLCVFEDNETPENFKGRIFFMTMFSDCSCWSRVKKLVGCSTRFSLRKEIWKRTMVIHWSWFRKEVVVYQRRQSTRRMGSYGGKNVGGINREWLFKVPFYKSIVSRSTRNPGHGNCRYTIQPIWKRLRLSNNCFCKAAQSLRSSRRNARSYETFHNRSGEPVVKGESMSSLVRSVIQTEMLLDCDDLADITPREIIKFFTGCRSSECCWTWTYIITKDTADSSQFHALACRQTLSRDEKSPQSKGWIHENKIGFLLEVGTFLYGQKGVENRSKSLSRDNIDSWVRISHGSN